MPGEVPWTEPPGEDRKAGYGHRGGEDNNEGTRPALHGDGFGHPRSVVSIRP